MPTSPLRVYQGLANRATDDLAGLDPITRVVMGNANSFDVIDNLEFGTAVSDVPEPASLRLLRTGRVVVAARRRLTKRV